MSVKLRFKTDFTDFLKSNEFSGSVKVVTKTEIIECSAVLLAQHSPVLREMLKEDNELFLTDNNHVRECLTFLYGGSVKLTEDNFYDILKFMVLYNIGFLEEQDQVLKWMEGKEWNLDNASILINSSIAVTKVVDVVVQSFRDSFLKPARLFFEKRMKAILDPNSTDIRYQSLDSAMEDLIPRIENKKELLKLLLHEDLIPDYIPWIMKLIDQSNYGVLTNSLEESHISNAMALLAHSQSEELFDKIENFENLTLKDFKQLTKCKLIINKKTTILESLRFMKENGNIYSCWKMLNEDGLEIFTNAFTSMSDQFCVIECLLSWYSENQPLDGKENFINDLTRRVIFRLNARNDHVMLDHYLSVLSQFRSYPYYQMIGFSTSNSFTAANTIMSIQGENIILKRIGYMHKKWRLARDDLPNVIITVNLFSGRIPEILVDNLEGGCGRVSIEEENEYGKIVRFDESKYNLFVYAVNTDNDRANDKDNDDQNENESKIDIKKRHIPLYCDPRAAHKMITDKLDREGEVVTIRDIYFHILFLNFDEK